MDWDCWNAHAADGIEECEHEPCERCGECHVARCRNFSEPCETCAVCGKVLLPSEHAEPTGGPFFGWKHKTCSVDDLWGRDIPT